MFGSLLMTGDGNPVVTYLGTYFSTTDRNGSAYPFTVNLGSAAPNRLIVATAGAAAENSGMLTGGTLDGVGMASVASAFFENTDRGSGVILSLVANTGSSATFNLLHNGSPTYSVVVDIFSIIGLESTTAFAANTSSGTGASLSTTLNVPARGVIIAAGGGWRTSTPYTWTGVDKVSEKNSGDGGGALSSGVLMNTSVQTGRTISWSTPSSGSRGVLLAASWR